MHQPSASTADTLEHLSRSTCPLLRITTPTQQNTLYDTHTSESTSSQDEYLLHQHRSFFPMYSDLSMDSSCSKSSRNFPFWEYRTDSDSSRNYYTKLKKHDQDHGYHTLVSQNIWYKGKPKGKSNPFDTLDDKIVIKIFSYLSSADLSCCAQVCKRFEVLAWQESLWKVIVLSGENVIADKAIRSVLRQLCGQGTTGACLNVEKVKIINGARISDKGVLKLAKRCPELLHLQIHGSSNITNYSLYEIINKCNNLQHLDITGCVNISSLTPIGGPELKQLQLQYLDLTDCPSVQDSDLKLIVQSCPHISYLYLRRCLQITDSGLKYLPSFCSGLRELSVSDCTNVTDFGLYELAKLGPILRYLSVAKCEQVSDAGLKLVVRRCYKLRYLNVRGCEAVSDEAILVLARSCTRLRALDIGKCDVSDAGLRALAECCPNLKKLSLRNCDLITDRGVQCIAYYCRGLQQLNIQDCQISLEGYRAVKKYCKRCVIEHTNPGFF